MIEESIVNSLIGSAEAGSWSVFAGYAILAACAIVRFLTRGKLSENASSWISASTTLLAGLGGALAAGGVWWRALVIGAFVLPSSRGFWDLVRGLLPGKGIAATLVFIGISCSACGNPCVNERLAVTALEAAANDAMTSIDDDSEEFSRARSITELSFEIGDRMVELCEAVRDDAKWYWWIGFVIRSTKDVIDILDASGVPIPDQLDTALSTFSAFSSSD